jgi:hypothetical protein
MNSYRLILKYYIELMDNLPEKAVKIVDMELISIIKFVQSMITII